MRTPLACWRLFKRFEEICDRLNLTNKANRQAQTESALDSQNQFRSRETVDPKILFDPTR